MSNNIHPNEMFIPTQLNGCIRGLGLNEHNVFFIVPNSFMEYYETYYIRRNIEKCFANSVYVGTKENCQLKLKDYPDHKII